jgi:hypothetical protein
MYCGATCKTRSYRRRKAQAKETGLNKLTTGEKEDLKFIRQFSEKAYGQLMLMRAAHGRAPFADALDAVYAAVKDTANSFFSS